MLHFKFTGGTKEGETEKTTDRWTTILINRPALLLVLMLFFLFFVFYSFLVQLVPPVMHNNQLAELIPVVSCKILPNLLFE